MKEISEEKQMQIFDLLEGNLNESEKLALIHEIEASASLRREYELMAKTYLKEDEPLVFANKAALYRKLGFVVNLHPIARYAAASAVLLLTGVAGWYYFKQGPKKQFVTNDNKQLEIPVIVIPKTEKSAVPTPKHKPVFFSNKNHTFNTPNRKDSSVKILTPEEIPNQKIETFAYELVTLPTDMAAVQEPEVKVVVNDTALGSILHTTPVPTAKKRSLSYKLINGGRAMLANLQLPDVKFITEKKQGKAIPTVKMSISTLKTDVIATLIE